MAGSYPDVPSRRMAYDDDGTVVIQWPTSGSLAEPSTALSEADQNTLNDESSSDLFEGGGGNQHRFGFLFPELREWDGAMYFDVNGTGSWDRSGDTTSGVDGTFTAQSVTNATSTVPGYRNTITSIALSNIRCVRYLTGSSGSGWRIQTIHLYGEISAGETPDRLLWIDEITGLEFTLPIDYGDIPRGSARDRELRLKNNSGSLTANTLQITAEDLTGGSGGWYTYDVAGGGFVSTNSDISSLGSGASSGLITVRQIIPDAATLGLHAARTYVNVASWS